MKWFKPGSNSQGNFPAEIFSPKTPYKLTKWVVKASTPPKYEEKLYKKTDKFNKHFKSRFFKKKEQQ